MSERSETTQLLADSMAVCSHTPGPWKVIPPGHGHPSEYLCVQYGADEMYTSLEMLPADAALTAAAPELLAACRASWDLGHKIYHNANAHEADLDWRMVRKLLQTAFDKVEGKS